eukprot:Lithocolla_globosa_v1_NODE_5264_length_1272_cov_17.329499.p1 type:complete len:244 gc:universal NODE_5264_length_1272_cov_17.329499:982-251(-)
MDEYQWPEWEEGVVGGFACLCGILLVFLGYRLIKVTFFCAGCALGYICCYLVMDAAGVTDELTLVLSSFAAGVVLGALLVMLYKTSVFLVGGICGLTFGVWFLTWFEIQQGEVIEKDYWKWTFLGVVSLICAILTLIIDKFFLVLSTSWFGAYLTFWGVDIFAQTGFTEAFKQILTQEHDEFYEYSDGVYAMMCGAFALFLVGVLVQWCKTAVDVEHDPEEKERKKLKWYHKLFLYKRLKNIN